MMTINLPRKPPGLKSLPKAWWVKEIAADIYVSGRPTSRQIKYAAEAGFGALVSLYSDDESSTLGENYVPNTEEIEEICTLADVEFDSIIDKDDEWASIKTIDKFGETIASMKRPLLLVGDTIMKATYIALIYFLQKSATDKEFEPKITAEDVYSMCAALGMIPIPPEVDELIADISDEVPDKDDVINIDTDSALWTKYWPAQHISKIWYMAGQIRRDELEPIKAAGFKSIVNMRLGMTNNGKPSQEQVTLLNIPDGLQTLSEDQKPLRQDPGIAIQNRIKPNVDNAYIDQDSSVNFETRNNEEFGDDVGYNEEIEREFFKEAGLDYCHFPLTCRKSQRVIAMDVEKVYIDQDSATNFETRNNEEFGDDVGYNEEIERVFFKETGLDYCHFPLVSGGTYDKSMFDNMKDTLLEFAKKGPVLLHCRSARRTAYFGVLIAAVQEGRSLQWAVKRVAELGFPIGPDQHPHTYKMYCDVLC